MHGTHRLVIGALEGMCRRMWGFPPRMIRTFVEQWGPLRALGWFCRNMPRYCVTLAVLGPVRTHLACVVISMSNGCAYCAFGHAYALELIYLRDRHRLFPLDAQALGGWLDLDPRRLRDGLRDVLQEADLHAEVVWAERTIDLVTGDQQPVDHAEARIAHLVRMVGTMNAVAVAHGVTPDEAHDAVNKDVRLKFEHAGLRAGLV